MHAANGSTQPRAHAAEGRAPRLNEQTKRNIGRFPPDFMFQLSRGELAISKSQIAEGDPRLRPRRRRVPTHVQKSNRVIAPASVIKSAAAPARSRRRPSSGSFLR
jgi:hypothetical protein